MGKDGIAAPAASPRPAPLIERDQIEDSGPQRVAQLIVILSADTPSPRSGAPAPDRVPR